MYALFKSNLNNKFSVWAVLFAKRRYVNSVNIKTARYEIVMLPNGRKYSIYLVNLSNMIE